MENKKRGSHGKQEKRRGVRPKIVYQPEEMLSKLLQLPGGNQINMYCQVK
jgi:hypothetical protein